MGHLDPGRGYQQFHAEVDIEERRGAGLAPGLCYIPSSGRHASHRLYARPQLSPKTEPRRKISTNRNDETNGNTETGSLTLVKFTLCFWTVLIASVLPCKNALVIAGS